MPYRNTDPMVKALHAFAAATGLSAEVQEQILICIEGKRAAAARARYAAKRATGWRRKFTPAQKTAMNAAKKLARARKAAAAKAAQRTQLLTFKKDA